MAVFTPCLTVITWCRICLHGTTPAPESATGCVVTLITWCRICLHDAPCPAVPAVGRSWASLPDVAFVYTQNMWLGGMFRAIYWLRSAPLSQRRDVTDASICHLARSTTVGGTAWEQDHPDHCNRSPRQEHVLSLSDVLHAWHASIALSWCTLISWAGHGIMRCITQPVQRAEQDQHGAWAGQGLTGRNAGIFR